MILESMQSCLFADFETIIANFESIKPDYLPLLRIHVVTLCPIRCLKARLNVL